MTDVEVIIGDGGLKEKPKNKKQKIKVEESVVQEISEEDKILREFGPVQEKQQVIQPDYQNTKEDEVSTSQQIKEQQSTDPIVKSEANQVPSTIPKKILENYINQNIQNPQTSEISNQKYLPGMQFIEHIGVGGMCVVDRVKDNSGLELAFKGLNERTMQITSISDAESRIKAVKLLREEARTINQLAKDGSQYTPEFAFDQTHSDNPGIYVKYIPNSLEERIQTGLSVKDASSLFFQMAQPIKMLHEKGISLMDIKPSNYRIDESGRVILVDLNLKRVKEAHKTSDSLMLSCVTESGKTIGTPLYMSPEQEEGKIQNGKEHLVDVYQLSSALYQLLTGIRPAGHPDSLEEFSKIKDEIGVEKTIKLNNLIQRGRSRNIDKRPQSVDDLVREANDIFGYEEKTQENSSSGEIELKNKIRKLETQLKSSQDVYQPNVNHEESSTELLFLANKASNKIGYLTRNHIIYEIENEKAKSICFISGLFRDYINLLVYNMENMEKTKNFGNKLSSMLGKKVNIQLSDIDSFSLSKRQTRKLLKQSSLEDKVNSLEVSSLEVSKNTAISIFNGLKTAAYIAISPLMIPSNIIKGFEKNSYHGPLGVVSGIASIIGMGIVADAYNVHGNEALIPLGVFAAANIASGTYELARYHKNKIFKRKKEGLKNYNSEEILRKVEQGDFTFLVKDNKFRSREDEGYEGRRLFKKSLKPLASRYFTPEEVYGILIKGGIADTLQTAKSMIDALKDKDIYIGINNTFTIEEITNYKGKKRYKMKS